MSALRFFRSSLIAILLFGMFSTAALAAPKETSPRVQPDLPAQAAERAVGAGVVKGRPEARTAPVAPAVEETDASSTSQSLDVMTYNIHFGIGTDGAFDLERIAQVIEASGAEVVGLQEVDRHYHSRSNWMDAPTWLAERLGMHMAYGANIDLDPLVAGQPRRQYGNAILSAYPITSSVNVPLPNHGSEQRGALDVTIDVNGTAVRVVNTHLSHWSFEERHAQTTAIAQLLGADAASAVVLGDFNAVSTSVEMSPLAEVLDDTWTDAAKPADGFTYPSAAPRARIDFVFRSADVRTAAAETVASLASDHLPVVASVSIG